MTQRKRARNALYTFCADQDGQVAIQYGLVASIVSITAIGAIVSLGRAVDTIYRVSIALLNRIFQVSDQAKAEPSRHRLELIAPSARVGVSLPGKAGSRRLCGSGDGRWLTQPKSS